MEPGGRAMTVVLVGDAGGNLSGNSSAIVQTGFRGEQRLARRIEQWAASKNGPILIAYSIRSDNVGDVDCVIATGRSVLMVDAKAFKSGYTYGVTKDGKLRRVSGLRKPRGRSFGRGGVIHAESQAKRFFAMLEREGVSGFSLLEPVVVLSTVLSDGARVCRDGNWEKAPFTLLSSDELNGHLDQLFPDSEIYGSTRLKQLGEVMRKHHLSGVAVPTSQRG